MIVAINYANKPWENAQKLNSKMALKYGAEKVIEYTPEDIDATFLEENKDVLNQKRGNGYYLWKPYIIADAFEKTQRDDYIVYTDAGSVFIRNFLPLIDIMREKKLDVMAFCNCEKEINWSKRDALILMGMDNPQTLQSNQFCGGYVIVRNCEEAKRLITEWVRYAKDERIVTDNANVMGYENYSEFRENRHDQTVWSLLCKKNGVPAFRDPSQYGLDEKCFADDVIERSTYPQMIYSHRNKDVKYIFELPTMRRWYHYPVMFILPKTSPFVRRIKRIINRVSEA